MKTKTLHIIRHGKALHSIEIDDVDRPLIVKGIHNNIANAKSLISKYSAPQLIISSHAARALQTAHIFARETGYPHEKIIVNEKLYLNGAKETYNIIKNLPENIDSVMIVGHNPDMTFVANRFSANIGDLPTSGVVSILFEANQWSEIESSKYNNTIIQ